MPSFSVQSWVDYSLCLAHSFSLCLLRNQQLLMLVCRGFVLWHSAMHLAVLWMAVSPHPEASEKVFRLPLSLSWAPAYFVLSGFIQYLHISRRFHHCIFCISSHGELQDLQKLCFFVVSFNIIYSKNSPSSIGGR